MKYVSRLLFCFVTASTALGNQISESQQQYIKKYKSQTKKVTPEDALINTEAEPDLDEGFVNLYNGKDLDNWIPRGGVCTYEATPDAIIGICVPGSPSTYLSTKRDDYKDFIFTAELKWIVNGNSGIMFRAQSKPGKKGEVVFGPQVEMEGFTPRGWSGGIYGQSAGGWFYPLWLDAHTEVRQALRENEWNRVTIKAVGKTIQTWINGIPAAHWETEDYLSGFFSLQVHSGKEGEIHFRNIKVKELGKNSKDLFAAGDFSQWAKVNGQPVDSGWTIENGVVHRNGIRPGAIITKQHFKDFDLNFEWKISQAGNSGVKYRTRGNLGLEYQVLDDTRHKDAKKPNHRAASLYDLVAAPDNKPINPVGEWNQGRIVAKGDQIEHWLNGEKIVEITYGTDDWNERFQKSKYKEHPGFGSWTGPILLQDHYDKVWYRNVQIREL
ncbi:MAG: DUF1080 domain-containing protein [Verrucomicrobiota bacterium]